MEPGGFLAVFRKTWKIRNEREAVDVAPKFVSSVIHKGNPFWLRFSDHAEVFEMLLRDEESRDLSGPDGSRAKKAIALAMILHGAERTHRVVEAKLRSIRQEKVAETKSWASKLFASYGGEQF